MTEKCKPYIPRRRFETIDRQPRFGSPKDESALEPDLSENVLKKMLGYCGVECQKNKKGALKGSWSTMSRSREFIVLILILISLLIF